MNAAANLIEKVVGRGDATVTTNVSNPEIDIAKYADTTTPMKALTWQGKNHVEISSYSIPSYILQAIY